MKKKVNIGPTTIGIFFAVFAAAIIKENTISGIIYLMIAGYLLLIAE